MYISSGLVAFNSKIQIIVNGSRILAINMKAITIGICKT